MKCFDCLGFGYVTPGTECETCSGTGVPRPYPHQQRPSSWPQPSHQPEFVFMVRADPADPETLSVMSRLFDQLEEQTGKAVLPTRTQLGEHEWLYLWRDGDESL